MKLDEVRRLKLKLVELMLAESEELRSRWHKARRAEILEGRRGETSEADKTAIALGITGHGPDKYRLAVRVQRRALLESPLLDQIIKEAGGKQNVDVKYIGRVVALVHRRRGRASAAGTSPSTAGGPPAPAPGMDEFRPLKIGSFVGSQLNDGGTLGCFVVDSANPPKVSILSNNHVLTDEDYNDPGPVLGGSPSPGYGQTIYQPLTGDFNRYKVAKLECWMKLGANAINLIDAATAKLDSGMHYDATTIGTIGNLSGSKSPPDPPKSLHVAKYGEASGQTTGTTTATEVDNLKVFYYSVGQDVIFNHQIEIAGDRGPFAVPGDSGSLVVDLDDLKAVGLLFTRSDSDETVAYANPLDEVLNRLGVKLCTTSGVVP